MPNGAEREGATPELATAGDGGPAAPAEWQQLLRCPVDLRPLCRLEGGTLLTSADGARRYPVVDGIPCLFGPNEWPPGKADVTDIVKAFYEETPFPNYDELDSRETLARKAARGVFARLLDQQLGRPAVVLEAGCGTGQLTNFLGMGWDRVVIGGDICLNSLRLGASFRDRFSIENAHFVQMNLFRPPFADETFDLVVCNGVLHHTSDPEGGFHALARKLKPGGLVIVGLYNRLGRLPTLWRRKATELLGERGSFLDARVRRGALNRGRRDAWYRDQYRHPHESRHGIDEVMGWLERGGIQPLLSIPPAGGEPFTESTQLFQPHPTGSKLDRLFTELGMLLAGGRDGGLFMTIGRKRASKGDAASGKTESGNRGA